MEKIFHWQDISNYQEIHNLVQLISSPSVEIRHIDIDSELKSSTLIYDRLNHVIGSGNSNKEIIPGLFSYFDKRLQLHHYYNIDICQYPDIVTFIIENIPHICNYLSDNQDKSKFNLLCYVELKRNMTIGEITDVCSNFFAITEILKKNSEILSFVSFCEMVSTFYESGKKNNTINCAGMDIYNWFRKLETILKASSLKDFLSDYKFIKEYKIVENSSKNFKSLNTFGLFKQFRNYGGDKQIFSSPYFHMYSDNPELKLIDFINNYI